MQATGRFRREGPVASGFPKLNIVSPHQKCFDHFIKVQWAAKSFKHAAIFTSNYPVVIRPFGLVRLESLPSKRRSFEINPQ